MAEAKDNRELTIVLKQDDGEESKSVVKFSELETEDQKVTFNKLEKVRFDKQQIIAEANFRVEKESICEERYSLVLLNLLKKEEDNEEEKSD